MLAHTESFKRLKTEQQSIIDFGILTLQAVNQLGKSFKLYEGAGTFDGIKNFDSVESIKNEKREEIPKNYFTIVNDKENFEKKLTHKRFKKLKKQHKFNLSKYMLISGFSFFEAYFMDVLEELIDFHGGHDYYKRIKSRSQEVLKKMDSLNKGVPLPPKLGQ
ncbi:hypothetical protein SapgrDRAFT_2905 [Saprospira grandis DSM 2844]|uniref:Uncharacterized protein n=1 Tax=Saprospira grandis DSM 2844 TaxID=694433 RepID=J0PAC2_9BACT|nr:hypothetical protein [Saprospira grandis]EJF54557.1 hypothetical protein SapgrDRAFT_2905 [Saprospira grandis DSM 2844]